VNPFRSLRDYEIWIYSLPERFGAIAYSTLLLAQRGRQLAELTGEIAFSDDCRLVVYERLTWDAGALLIEGYGYEVWGGSNKLYWYDSQPHADDSLLASTDPHHKHIPPDIKHHRVPAPGLSFDRPNLPILIEEIEHDLLTR
jgi:Family of unknown function (DUF6516)